MLFYCELKSCQVLVSITQSYIILMTTDIIISIISLLGGGAVVAGINAFANRGKLKSEEYKILIDSLSEAVSNLRQENKEFYIQNKQYRISNDELKARVLKLEEQLNRIENAKMAS